MGGVVTGTAARQTGRSFIAAVINTYALPSPEVKLSPVSWGRAPTSVRIKSSVPF